LYEEVVRHSLYILEQKLYIFEQKIMEGVRMNVTKSILAALFVGEVGYLLGIVIAATTRIGIRTNSAMGAGAWLSLAQSWIALITGLLFCLTALWVFLRS
jgi:hypothetical protein